jgi:hypothetical protein
MNTFSIVVSKPEQIPQGVKELMTPSLTLHEAQNRLCAIKRELRLSGWECTPLSPNFKSFDVLYKAPDGSMVTVSSYEIEPDF